MIVNLIDFEQRGTSVKGICVSSDITRKQGLVKVSDRRFIPALKEKNITHVAMCDAGPWETFDAVPVKNYLGTSTGPIDTTSVPSYIHNHIQQAKS